VQQEDKRPGIERHVQTILASLITAGIVYLITDQIGSARLLAATQVSMKFLTDQIVELRSDVKAMQQINQQYVRQSQYEGLEERVRRLENHK
jgi:TolA-binding protein